MISYTNEPFWFIPFCLQPRQFGGTFKGIGTVLSPRYPRSPMPLTDIQVRKAKPGSKPVRMFDERGLYLEVRPAGGKWWRFKYRFAGKEKLLALGTYPDVSLKEAAEKRDAARKLLAAGVDPSQARKAEKALQDATARHTLEIVARAWLAHRASAWTPGTQKTIRASLENDVFPILGDRPVADVTPADLREAVKRIEARGAGETASRVFQRLQSVFRYAVAHELVAVDPTYPLKPSEIFRPRKVTHRAAIAERDAPAFLRKLGAYEGDESTKAALMLLILTAVRPGEVRGAAWAEFDLSGAVWSIPAERMKMRAEHLVPLSRQALALITKLRSTAADSLVFPSPFYPGRPLSDGTLNSALSRLGYKGLATAHGFRSLFSTCANEAGWNRDVIEKQLAHEERNPSRQAYNRAQYLEERARMMQWWADTLEAMREGGRAMPIKVV